MRYWHLKMSNLAEPLIGGEHLEPGASVVVEQQKGTTKFRADKDASWTDPIDPRGFLTWFSALKSVFGWRLLATLFFSQHVLKGLVAGGGTGGWIGVQGMNYYFKQVGGASEILGENHLTTMRAHLTRLCCALVLALGLV